MPITLPTIETLCSKESSIGWSPTLTLQLLWWYWTLPYASHLVHLWILQVFGTVWTFCKWWLWWQCNSQSWPVVGRWGSCLTQTGSRKVPEYIIWEKTTELQNNCHILRRKISNRCALLVALNYWVAFYTKEVALWQRTDGRQCPGHDKHYPCSCKAGSVW